MTSLDSINGQSIQMLLRGENDSKQSDEFQTKFGHLKQWSSPATPATAAADFYTVYIMLATTFGLSLGH